MGLVASPEVASALLWRPGAVAEAEARLGRKVAIRAEAGRRRDDVAIEELP